MFNDFETAKSRMHEVDRMNIPDGPIFIDSDHAKQFDFTSDRFETVCYLWKKSDQIYISLIISKKRGNFKRLLNKINSLGFDAVVPNPLPAMEDICKYLCMKKSYENDPMFGPFVIYFQPAPKKDGAHLRAPDGGVI